MSAWMPLERVNYNKADRQSLLTAWKSRNTSGDPALWSTIPQANANYRSLLKISCHFSGFA